METYKILSLDLGDKFIGCAISDSRRILVSPLSAIFVENQILKISSIRKLMKIHKPKKIIVGIPYLTDGSISNHTKKYLSFAKKMKKVLSEVTIELVDETLSTWITKKKFKRLKLSKTQNKVNIDSFTAMELLNQYLGIHS